MVNWWIVPIALYAIGLVFGLRSFIYDMRMMSKELEDSEETAYINSMIPEEKAAYFETKQHFRNSGMTDKQATVRLFLTGLFVCFCWPVVALINIYAILKSK